MSTGVLHLQCRAYPLHHRTPATALAPFTVPGHGELRPVLGSLDSLAYNPDTTVELDLTDIVRPAVALPGVEVVACRARILTAGTVLVVYALRHEQDLRLLSLLDLDALDAGVNRVLRESDGPILSAVLAAAVGSGLVRSIALRPDLAVAGSRSPIDRRSARYNAHFVCQDPPWQQDSRVPGVSSGPGCRILLPYTYAWDRDPTAPFADLLTMTEPTDIAVAQQSLLAGALIAGRWVLGDLAHAHPASTDVHAFRRFLDGLWADFHHLDSYRVESSQAHRASYLAARRTIGLDDTQERADKLLGYVSSSLLAAASERAEALDARLNRVAAALTVVSAASFGLDIAVFVLPQVSLGTKIAVVVGLLGMAASGLVAAMLPGALRRSLQRRGPGVAGAELVGPVPVRVPAAAGTAGPAGDTAGAAGTAGTAATASAAGTAEGAVSGTAATVSTAGMAAAGATGVIGAVEANGALGTVGEGGGATGAVEANGPAGSAGSAGSTGRPGPVGAAEGGAPREADEADEADGSAPPDPPGVPPQRGRSLGS
ncbi:hypothetical protein RVR_4854 [Actinacidiphila reveromycinica]|uniref:Uncharacterized protein n=1 Tax=Actinacidiphila reveromycinica TaxID=659352 RepID=A0A7U3UTS6_9ACTN|nr:hypothetical protein [Streptomyces sp. SN-593]BBA98605.1 hypothetical protein RVR_4854 [Streptomyces sp. SN-593]